MIGGTMLFAAFALCVIASRPADIFVEGYEPQRLFPATPDETWMKRYTIEDIQARISANRALIEARAPIRETAVILALLAVLVLFLTVVTGLVFWPHGKSATAPGAAAGSAPAAVVVRLPAPALSNLCTCSRWDILASLSFNTASGYEQQKAQLTSPPSPPF